MIRNNQTIAHDICAKCGGKCCQYSGCSLFPGDLKIPLRYNKFNKLVHKLKSEDFSVKMAFFQDTFTRTYAYQLRLRMRNVGKPIIDLFSDASPCVKWSETGCALTDKERPYGGINLIPNVTHICRPNYSMQYEFDQWQKHTELMHDLFLYFSNGVSPKEMLYKQYSENVESVRIMAKEDYSYLAFITAVEAYLKQENLI